jgi:hypothetical protein
MLVRWIEWIRYPNRPRRTNSGRLQANANMQTMPETRGCNLGPLFLLVNESCLSLLQRSTLGKVRQGRTETTSGTVYPASQDRGSYSSMLPIHAYYYDPSVTAHANHYLGLQLVARLFVGALVVYCKNESYTVIDTIYGRRYNMPISSFRDGERSIYLQDAGEIFCRICILVPKGFSPFIWVRRRSLSWRAVETG